MFGKRLRLFTMFGFDVKIDLSWLFIALLVTWTLAVGFFPRHLAGYSSAAYWAMGITGALGLFASIIIHEFCHSIVARRFGLPMRGITLFIFGGVAEMHDEPPSPKAEFFMAAAGPAASVLLSVGSFGLSLLVAAAGGVEPLAAILWYLGFINAILVAFNLMPGFPLDGGRILRSILWHWKRNIRWATRVASNVGAAFGAVLIVLAVLFLFAGLWINAMWFFLIGLFLRSAAAQSYQQVVVRQTMEGERLERFINRDPVTVPPETPLDELIESFIYRYHHKMFPVTRDGRVLGCVTLREVKEVPEGERSAKLAGDVMERCGPENTISPHVDATKALSQMNRTQKSRLMVVEDGHLLGVVTLKDMMKFLSLKMELEDGGGTPGAVRAVRESSRGEERETVGASQGRSR